MLDQINTALQNYFTQWQAVQGARTDETFFAALKPVALGWKTQDRAEYDRIYAELHDDCDHISEVWMNGRWIAKIHLRDQQVEGGIKIIKLMERRPESTDATGLDHVDFYTEATDNGRLVLAAEPNLKWTEETNDVLDDYTWISIWFGETEAKLKHSTVINNVIRELEIINQQIIA